MRELEENTIREYMYSENAARMRAVKKRQRITRIYNVYANIPIAIISAVSVFFWLLNAGMSVRAGQLLAADPQLSSPPVKALLLPVAAAAAVLTFFSDAYLIKRLNIVCEIIYAMLFGYSVLLLVLAVGAADNKELILMAVYAAGGFFTEELAVRSYYELDELKKLEGFPDFNYMIDRENHSKYVKYREKWLKSEKQLDYFTDSERPVLADSVLCEEESAGMGSVGIDEATGEKWFDGKDAEKNAPPSSEIPPLAPDGVQLADDSEYYIDDPRRRPL